MYIGEIVFAAVALVVVVLAAIHDLKTRLVPNIVSLSLLALAVSWRLGTCLLAGEAQVGVLAVYLAMTMGIFLLWLTTPMGGGDAKLWMALVWVTPPAFLPAAPLVFGLAYGGGAIVQAAVRALLRRPILRVALPATWRTVPYAAWLAYTITHMR